VATALAAAVRMAVISPACDHANRRARLGIEQNHQPLVRLHSLGEVVLKDADQLRAERTVPAHRARHHAEQPALRQRIIDRRSCLVSPFENAIIASRTIGMHTS
jgi:hypothetical protein